MRLTFEEITERIEIAVKEHNEKFGPMPLTVLNRRFNKLVSHHLGKHFSFLVEELCASQVLHIDRQVTGKGNVYTFRSWNEKQDFYERINRYLEQQVRR